MTMELTHGVKPITTNGAAFARVVMNKMRAAFAAYARAKRERSNIRALQMLDNRLLADIGICRSEIAFHVREAAAMKTRS